MKSVLTKLIFALQRKQKLHQKWHLDAFTHCLMQDSSAFNLQIQMRWYGFDILNIKLLILIFEIIKKKMKIYFKCEIKTASRWQQVTVNKWVIGTEPNHLNYWFIREQNSCYSETQI